MFSADAEPSKPTLFYLDVTDEQPEVKTVNQQDVEETKQLDVKDAKKPEVKDTMKPEVKDTKKPEVKDAKKPEVMDTKKPEVMDTKKPEVKDQKQTTPRKKEQNNNQLNKPEPKPVLPKQKAEVDKTADNKENTKDNVNVKEPVKKQTNGNASENKDKETRGKAPTEPKGILKKTKEEELKEPNLSKKPKIDDKLLSKKDGVASSKQSLLKTKESDKKEGDKKSVIGKDASGGVQRSEKVGNVEKVKPLPVKLSGKNEDTSAKDSGSTKTKSAEKASPSDNRKEAGKITTSFDKKEAGKTTPSNDKTEAGKTTPSYDKKEGKTIDIEKVKSKSVKTMEKKDDTSAMTTNKTNVKEIGKQSLKSVKSTETKEDSTPIQLVSHDEKLIEKTKVKPVSLTTREKTPIQVDGEKRNGVEKVKLKPALPPKQKDDLSEVLTRPQTAAEKVSLKQTQVVGNTNGVKPDNFKNVKLLSVKKSEKDKDASPELTTKKKEFEKVSLKSVETKPVKITVISGRSDVKPEEGKKLKLKSVNGGEKNQTDRMNLLNSAETKSDELKNVMLKSTKTTAKLETKSEEKAEFKIKAKLKTIFNDAKKTEDAKVHSGSSDIQSKDKINEDTSRAKHRRASEPRINKIDFMKQVFEKRVDKVWRSRSAERPRSTDRTTEKQNLEETKGKMWIEAKIIIEEETTPQAKISSEKEVRILSSKSVEEVRTTAVSQKKETNIRNTESKKITSKHEVGVKMKVEQSTQKDSNKISSKLKEGNEKLTQITSKQNASVKKETVIKKVIKTTQTEAKSTVDQRAATKTTSVAKQQVSARREATQGSTKQTIMGKIQNSQTEINKGKQQEGMMTSAHKDLTRATENREEFVTVSRGSSNSGQLVQTKHTAVYQQERGEVSNGLTSAAVSQVREIHHAIIVEGESAQKTEPAQQPRTVRSNPGQEYLNVRKAFLKNANFEMGDQEMTAESFVTSSNQCSDCFYTNTCNNQNGHASGGLDGVLHHSEYVKHKDDACVNRISNDSSKKLDPAESTLVRSDITHIESAESSDRSLSKNSSCLTMQKPNQSCLTRSQIFHLLESRQCVNVRSGEISESVRGCSTNGGNNISEQRNGVGGRPPRADDNPIKTEIKNKINEHIELRNSPKSSRKHKPPKTKLSSQTKPAESSQPNIRSPITFSFPNSVARRHGSTSPPSDIEAPVVGPEMSIKSRLNLFPFRRKFEFEDVAFLLCLLTFSALWTGMPSLTFVLLVITVELLYVLIFCCWT